jgi:hypothetical protein
MFPFALVLAGAAIFILGVRVGITLGYRGAARRLRAAGDKRAA